MEKMNLWSEVKDIPDIKTPVFILREQAKLVSENTSSLLLGIVREFKAGIYNNKLVTNGSLHFLGFELSIVAPKLNSYTYEVLSIAYHPTSVYPVYVRSHVLSKEPSQDSTVICENEERYVDVLGIILSSDHINKVIQNLILQSKDNEVIIVVDGDPDPF